MGRTREDDRTRANCLLAHLPPIQRDAIVSRLEPVSLTKGTVLHEQGAPIPHVYFPISAVISLLAILEEGASVEVATVGLDGMVGLAVCIGMGRAATRAVVQIAGDALRVRSNIFEELLSAHHQLRNLIRRYTQCLFTQFTRSAACNRFHSLEQRCARWLLTAHDRAVIDQFPLTQEGLSGLLGATRQAIGITIERLEGSNLIKTSRGTVTMVDRAGLERLSCECYRVIRDEFQDTLDLTPPSTPSS